MALELSSGPAVEPVSLAEAKVHLRYDSSDQDDYLTTLIQVARETIERWEWRAHITQTWLLKLDGFPSGGTSPIYLPRPPVQSITSIAYVDADGDSQTWAAANYQVDTAREPGRVLPVYGKVWPTTQPQTTPAVTVTYVAGYGDAASDVPEQTKHAIKLMLAHVWRNPELVVMGTIVTAIPMAVDALLRRCHDARVLEFCK